MDKVVDAVLTNDNIAIIVMAGVIIAGFWAMVMLFRRMALERDQSRDDARDDATLYANTLSNMHSLLERLLSHAERSKEDAIVEHLHEIDRHIIQIKERIDIRLNP